jgi:hypothetical protein
MNDDITQRLARMESKLTQLMLHMGLDPTVRKYDTPRLVNSPQVWRKRDGHLS